MMVTVLVAMMIALNISIRQASRYGITSWITISRWNASSLRNRCSWTMAVQRYASYWRWNRLGQGRAAGPRGYRTHSRGPKAEALDIWDVMIVRWLRKREMTWGQCCGIWYGWMALLISRMGGLDTGRLNGSRRTFSEWLVFVVRFPSHLCLFRS